MMIFGAWGSTPITFEITQNEAHVMKIWIKCLIIGRQSVMGQSTLCAHNCYCKQQKSTPCFYPWLPFCHSRCVWWCPDTLWLLLCRFWACNGQKMCLNWTLVVHYKPKTCIPNMGHVFNLIFELEKVHDCLLVITVFFSHTILDF